MHLEKINPERIWPFQPNTFVRTGLLDIVKNYGWKDIPPIPIFVIPSNLEKEHEYILIDGHHRRNVALEIPTNIPCAIYKIGETIDIIKNGLAPFRHSNDPRLYEKLLKAYQMRDTIHELIAQKLSK